MSDWRDQKAQMSVFQRAQVFTGDPTDGDAVRSIAAFGHACAAAELERRRVADERAERLSGRLEVVAAERNSLQAELAAAERERDTALAELADERKANAKAAREAAYWREDHGGKLAAAERERDELLAALSKIEQSEYERVYDDVGNGNQRERFVVDSACVKRIAREAIAAAEGKG